MNLGFEVLDQNMQELSGARTMQFDTMDLLSARGSTCTVYTVQCNGEYYALKQIDHDIVSVEGLQEEKNAYQIVGKILGVRYALLRRQNSKNLFDAILLELYDTNCHCRFSSRGLLCQAVDTILLQLEQLHRAGLVHGDVKEENILRRQHEDGKTSFTICDFGYMKMEEDIIQVDLPVNYPVWGVPAQLQGTYAIHDDYRAFMMTFLMWVVGRHCYQNQNEVSVISRKYQDHIAKILEDDAELQQAVLKALNDAVELDFKLETNRSYRLSNAEQNSYRVNLKNIQTALRKYSTSVAPSYPPQSPQPHCLLGPHLANNYPVGNHKHSNQDARRPVSSLLQSLGKRSVEAVTSACRSVKCRIGL